MTQWPHSTLHPEVKIYGENDKSWLPSTSGSVEIPILWEEAGIQEYAEKAFL